MVYSELHGKGHQSDYGQHGDSIIISFHGGGGVMKYF